MNSSPIAFYVFFSLSLSLSTLSAFYFGPLVIIESAFESLLDFKLTRILYRGVVFEESVFLNLLVCVCLFCKCSSCGASHLVGRPFSACDRKCS